VPLAAAHAIASKVDVHLSWVPAGTPTELVKDGAVVATHPYEIALHIAQLAPELGLDGTPVVGSTFAQQQQPQQPQQHQHGEKTPQYLVSHMTADVAAKYLSGVTDFAQFTQSVDRMNEHLKMRSFISGYALTVSDLACADAIKNAPLFKKLTQAPGGTEKYAHTLRWIAHVESHECYQSAVAALAAQVTKEKEVPRD